MFSKHKTRLLVLSMLAPMTQACVEARDNQSPDSDWFATGDAVADTPSYEEYRTAASSRANGKGFIVETDMFFAAETQLQEYYRERFIEPTTKSIINTTSGVRDLRTNPTNIRYCFCAGWGQNQGSYTAPALTPVRTAIQQAMTAWEGVAKLRFTYMSSLDGATCTTSGANPGVDFVVQHYDNPGTAIGPFPSNPWGAQQLKVPTSGINRLLAIHELGHTLGLRHEHIHSGASPRCSEGDTHYEELTGFDTASSMKYSNCQSSMVINGTEISALDGVGIRLAYGAPDWWWATL